MLVSIVSLSRPSLITIASGTQFQIYLPWGQHSLVGTFIQEKAQLGAFSVIVKA